MGRAGLDALTELPTHRELPGALGEATPLALFVDLAGLVWLNDQLGFTHGDAALRSVARLLVECFERGVFRIGGDEFLVLLPMLDPPAALRRAAEVVRRVRAQAIPYRNTRRPQQTVLEVNVVVLRLTRRLVEQGRAGICAHAQERIAARWRKGTPPGFVVGAEEAPR